MRKPKTIEEVQALVAELRQVIDAEATVGDAFLRWTDRHVTTAEEYVALMLIAMGKALPETYLLRRYPAIRRLRLFPLQEQIDFFRYRKPMDLLVAPEGDSWTMEDLRVEKRTFDQISARECKRLFHGKDPARQFVLCFRDLLRKGDTDRMIKIEYPSGEPH